ncbi:MAG: hypothetical protein JXQ73_12110 [Phycisphaerae bacterium]|nr:hypothetical protein [Phycisphaerae bacterium]
MLLIVITAPTVLAFWRGKRIPTGHCQHCGYDLTANTTGICPECGERI